eukprot:tig00000145_g8803.t1
MLADGAAAGPSAVASDPSSPRSCEDQEGLGRILDSLADQTLAEIDRLQNDVRPVSSFTSFALLDSILARRLAALSASLDSSGDGSIGAAPGPDPRLRAELDRLVLQRVVSEFSFHEALTQVLLRRAGRPGPEFERLSVSAIAGRFDAAAVAAAQQEQPAARPRPAAGEITSLLSHHLVSQTLANANFRQRLEQVLLQRDARRPRLAPRVAQRVAAPPGEVIELRRLMQACFEVSLDTQRAIRQEVAAALVSSSSGPRPAGAAPDGASESGSEGPRAAAAPGQCSVCLERAADTAFYKCGHQCACFLCARSIMDEGRPCVICRAPIADLLRVFVP